MQGFLFLRRKTYYFRRKIPAELRGYFSPRLKEIWRSLGTQDKCLAKSACRDWVAKTEKVFSMLRTSIPDVLKLEYVKTEIQPSSTAVHAPAPTPVTGKLTSELIASYVSHKAPTWTLKSKQEVEYSLGLFVALCGDLRLPKIDYAIIEDFRDKLKQLPANYTRLKKYKNQTIEELLAIPASEKDMPKAASVNKHIGFLSTLFKFAIQRQYMTFNPALGVQVKAPRGQKASGGKQIYTREDLQDVIQLLRYDEAHPENLWVPLISMHTGMRRGEICQLYVSDILIDEKSGLPYLQCEETEDTVDFFTGGELQQLPEKKLKAGASWRTIPIHPFLWEDLGFAGFVEECKKSGEKRMFPSLKMSRDGYGQTFSKYFDYNIARKLYPAYSGKSFHSFRHSFIDWFKQSTIQHWEWSKAVPIIREFVGHSYNPGGSEDITFERYGKQYPVETLASVLFQLDYGLNFDNITEQTGRFIALAKHIEKTKNLNPNLDYPTEVESP